MAQIKFNFDCFGDSSVGVLTPEDVKFFYYDICFDSEMGKSDLYNWNKDIEDFIAKNNMVIDDCVAASIPSTFSENKIYFTMGDEYKGNKAAAFLHHLRDAFAHYRIGMSGEYYCMKDLRKDKTITMIGKIHRRLLKELMELFFNQKANIEKEMDQYYYQEI
jgi:hypothetical protein